MKNKNLESDKLSDKLDKLSDQLDNADSLKKLSDSFNNINKAMFSACNDVYKRLYEYQLSRYLYYEYIILNKTYGQIAKQLGICSGTVTNYIRKYNIKKDEKAIRQTIKESVKKTCQERYGVDHPGSILEAHQKTVATILNKSNGHWDGSFYKALNKSEETRKKMSESQQIRRMMEKEGEKD